MVSLKTNATIDIFSFLLFLFVTLSGFVVWFTFGDVLGISRHVWKQFHNWTGLIFTVLMLIHLILHAKWIKNIPRYFRRKK